VGGRNAAQHNATQRSERRPPAGVLHHPVCRESLGARTHLRTVQARVVLRSKLPTGRLVERGHGRESWSITVRGPHRPEESPQCTVRRYGTGLPQIRPLPINGQYGPYGGPILPKLRPQITAIRAQIDLTVSLINERAPVQREGRCVLKSKLGWTAAPFTQICGAGHHWVSLNRSILTLNRRPEQTDNPTQLLITQREYLEDLKPEGPGTLKTEYTNLLARLHPNIYEQVPGDMTLGGTDQLQGHGSRRYGDIPSPDLSGQFFLSSWDGALVSTIHHNTFNSI
jgi:hypothetical protein